MRRRGLALVVGFALAVAPAAGASYGVVTDVPSAQLAVGADGTAAVTWHVGGAARTFLVPRSSSGEYGTAPPDASKSARAAVPFALVVRRTSDGTIWALQRRAVTGRPASIDLARWNGAPTQLTLASDGTRLRGRVTFHGSPVHGYSPTPGGTQIRVTVFLECYGCPAARSGWSLMLGVAPKADGTFAVFLRPSWSGSRYRATVQGPNVGGQLAPDAQAVIAAR
jgi:hypothetical protein